MNCLHSVKSAFLRRVFIPRQTFASTWTYTATRGRTSANSAEPALTAPATGSPTSVRAILESKEKSDFFFLWEFYEHFITFEVFNFNLGIAHNDVMHVSVPLCCDLCIKICLLTFLWPTLKARSYKTSRGLTHFDEQN